MNLLQQLEERISNVSDYTSQQEVRNLKQIIGNLNLSDQEQRRICLLANEKGI